MRNKRFDSIQNNIWKHLCNRLINRKKRVVEEDTKLRENMINKLCEVSAKEEIEKILKGIEPFLRNKRREIILMGANYEEFRKEIEEAIVRYMTSMPKIIKDSVQPETTSPVYVEASTPTKGE